MRTRIALVNCYICRQSRTTGPKDSASAPPVSLRHRTALKCTGPGVTITLYTDYSFTLDIEHRRGLSDATRRVMPMPLSPLGYHSCVVSGDFAGRR